VPAASYQLAQNRLAAMKTGVGQTSR